MEPEKRHMAEAYDLQAPGYDSAVGRGLMALMKRDLRRFVLQRSS